MLTVKVRAADGTETLYSCETVTVIGGPNCCRYVADERTDPGPTPRDMYREGIYLDQREEYPDVSGSQAEHARLESQLRHASGQQRADIEAQIARLQRELQKPFITAKHIIQFGGDETSDRQARKGGKVWVMNEAGATVATYDL